VLGLEQLIFRDHSQELLNLRGWVQESRRRRQNDQVFSMGLFGS
jgi:hypothetical protein